MISLKKIVILFLGLISSYVVMAQDHSEYENLYPDCVDNQESTIYGGTYNGWPKALIPPEFPGGGDVELTRFVHSSIEYPHVVESYAYPNGPDKDSVEVLAKGTVVIQIVVDRCGRATRQEIVQSVNDEYDMEALRITQGLPVFKPGEMNGVRVKVALLIPFHFTRSKMPPPPSTDYMEYDWDSEDSGYGSSSDSDNSSSGGGKYDNIQWDDSW